MDHMNHFNGWGSGFNTKEHKELIMKWLLL